jgi:hypothetical protein
MDDVVKTLLDFFSEDDVLGHKSRSGSSSGLRDISAIIPLSVDEKKKSYKILSKLRLQNIYNTN